MTSRTGLALILAFGMHDLEFQKVMPPAPWKHFLERTYQFRGCAETAKIYTANLHRLHMMAMIPGHAFMDGEGWKFACDKAMKEFGITDPLDPSFVVRAEQIFHEWWQGNNEAEKIRHFHEASFNTAKMWSTMPGMHETLHGLLQTMIIQAWTAFEVLAEHLWREATKLRSSLMNAMSKKEVGNLGFRSRGRIRNSYECTFKKDYSTIKASLSPTAIDALAVVRCILVHSAGKIDDWFLRDGRGVPEVAHLINLPVGTAVDFTASFTRSLIDSVTPCGYDLIQTVDNWLLS